MLGACAISLTARLNAASFAFDGFDVPCAICARTAQGRIMCLSPSSPAAQSYAKGGYSDTSLYCARRYRDALRQAPERIQPARDSEAAALCSVGLTAPMPEAKNA